MTTPQNNANSMTTKKTYLYLLASPATKVLYTLPSLVWQTMLRTNSKTILQNKLGFTWLIELHEFHLRTRTFNSAMSIPFFQIFSWSSIIECEATFVGSYSGLLFELGISLNEPVRARKFSKPKSRDFNFC